MPSFNAVIAVFFFLLSIFNLILLQDTIRRCKKFLFMKFDDKPADYSRLHNELVETFGSQCIVITIQARKKYGENRWEAMSEMGREKSNKDVLDWINEVQELGAGEILLTSVDKDGTLSNPDFDLINEASKITKIPLVVSGGFTKSSDIGNVS